MASALVTTAAFLEECDKNERLIIDRRVERALLRSSRAIRNIDTTVQKVENAMQLQEKQAFGATKQIEDGLEVLNEKVDQIPTQVTGVVNKPGIWR